MEIELPTGNKSIALKCSLMGFLWLAANAYSQCGVVGAGKVKNSGFKRDHIYFSEFL